MLERNAPWGIILQYNKISSQNMIDMWTGFQSMEQHPTWIASAFCYGPHPLDTKF
jgi:hypothetical protein